MFVTCGRSSHQHPSSILAQDNIIPIPPLKLTTASLLGGRRTFARYFVDVEVDQYTDFGRLTLSAESKAAYPEDEAFGAQWISEYYG